MEQENNSEKPWSEMTEKEIDEIKRKQCRFRAYAKRLGGSGEADSIYNMFCDYIGIVGKIRPCSPVNCTEFKRKTRRRRKKGVISDG